VIDLVAGSVVWEREWLVDGFVSHRFGRAADLVIAEWTGVGRLYAARDGSRSRFEAFDGADAGAADRVRRFLGEGLVRHLRGEIALHASSVVIGGVAVAFVGASGAGKSSIAAALCRRADVELAADDTLFIVQDHGTFRVVPTENANRLDRQDAAGLKRAVEPVRVAREGVPLGAIVALVADESATDPRLVALEGAMRFRVVSDALLRFVWDDDAMNLRDFETLGMLASEVPVLELRRRWELSAIARSVDAIVRAVASWSDR